jgi:hypothetical protein
MSIALKLTTPPASEPVSLAEAKAHLRISTAAEDTYITSLITVARQLCEQYTGRVLITQTWELWLDQIPAFSNSRDWRDGVTEGPISSYRREERFIEFPVTPVIDFVSVTAYDLNNSASDFSIANNLMKDLVREPARLVLNYGSIWPVNLRQANALKVVATCGYGDATAVPAIIKQAILLCIGHLFENREPVALGKLSKEIELGPFALLAQFKVFSI